MNQLDFIFFKSYLNKKTYLRFLQTNYQIFEDIDLCTRQDVVLAR